MGMRFGRITKRSLQKETEETANAVRTASVTFPHPSPLPQGEGESSAVFARQIRALGPVAAWRERIACGTLGQHRGLFPLPEGEGQGEGERDRNHRKEMDHSQNCRTQRVL